MVRRKRQNKGDNLMNKIKIFLINSFLLIFIISCSSDSNLQDINFENGLAYKDGNLFSGIASDYYNEGTVIKNTISFEDGKTIKKAYFSESGDLIADEIFLNNKISQRINYLDGEIFVVKDFNKNTIEANDLLCEEECIYENVTLEDLVISAITIKNVTFKNSKFKNVSFEGAKFRPDDVALLDNFKIIDSSLENLKFGENVAASYLTLDNVTGKIEVLIEQDEQAIISLKISNSDIEDFVLKNSHVGRFTDECYSSPNWENCVLNLSLETQNSSFKNFTFLNFSEQSRNNTTINSITPILSFKNTTIDSLNGLIVGMDASGDPINNAFLCDGLEVKDGKIPIIADYCFDMDSKFDQFGVKDFEKSYLPNNSLYLIAKYALEKPTDYENINYSTNRERDQRYALAVGDQEYLEKHISEVYKELLDFGSFPPNAKFYDISKCADSNLFYPQDKQWRRGYNSQDCAPEVFDTSDFITWQSLPEEFNSDVGEMQRELITSSMNYLQTYTVYEDGVRKGIRREAYEKKNPLIDSEVALNRYLEHYYDLSTLQNCYRGREAKEALDLLGTVKNEIPTITETYADRVARGWAILANESVSDNFAVSQFKQCLEGNVSIYVSQNTNAYSPLAKLAVKIQTDLSLYADLEERKKEEAKRKKRQQRKELFADFKKSPSGEACNILKEDDGAFIINYYFSGSLEAKNARLERAYNACLSCYFNLFSTTLGDEDFKKFLDGSLRKSNREIGFTVGDVRKMMMCPVAGADNKVRDLFARTLN